MSEVAKDRLLAVGARFSSYEQENASRSNHTTPQGGDNIPTLTKGNTHIQSLDSTSQSHSTGKMPFWKKNVGKVPGRAVYGAQHPPLHAADAHLATYIKGTRPKIKSGTSFQEFEGSTLDAWDEDTDEPLKIQPEVSPSSSPPTDSSNTEGDITTRSEMECISSQEEFDRPTMVAGSNEKSNVLPEKSKSSNIKNTVVNKLSEKLAKVNRSKSSSPVPVPDNNSGGNNGYMLPPMPPSPIRTVSCDINDQENSRLERFGKLLSGPTTDLDQLRKYSWNGIPNALRGTAWRLLSGYLPPSIDRRQATLERKQAEYQNFVQQYYPTRFEPLHQETFRQIHIDIPRTNPLIPIFQQEVLQEVFERILFIWAIRHPASGYVQGINDLVVPFFVVFLAEYVDKEVETYNINNVPKDILDMVEADTFWCVSKLLDGIQDNYTFAQPGIQMKVNALKNLVSRINDPLNNHILSHNIDYLQFTFRWMNNLLMRELPLKASIRLWDTYWAEPDGFAIFHLYVCAALFKRFADDIMSKIDFQSLMTFLQNLPCKDWRDEDISCLVSEAYQLKFLFADAPKHLRIT